MVIRVQPPRWSREPIPAAKLNQASDAISSLQALTAPSQPDEPQQSAAEVGSGSNGVALYVSHVESFRDVIVFDPDAPTQELFTIAVVDILSEVIEVPAASFGLSGANFELTLPFPPPPT